MQFREEVHIAEERPELQDGDTWGNWTFRQSDLTLQLRDPVSENYEIDLERIPDRAMLLHCLGHCTAKGCRAENIGNLVLALYDLSSADEWGADFSITDSVRERFRPSANAEAKVRELNC
jgi:hypothetical protein